MKSVMGDPATCSCHSIPFHCASHLWHCACVVEHLGLLLFLATDLERGEGIAGPRKINGFHFGSIVCFYFPQSEPVCIGGSVLGEVLGPQVMYWKLSQMRVESWFDLMLLFVSSQAAVVAQHSASKAGSVPPLPLPHGPSWLWSLF